MAPDRSSKGKGRKTREDRREEAESPRKAVKHTDKQLGRTGSGDSQSHRGNSPSKSALRKETSKPAQDDVSDVEMQDAPEVESSASEPGSGTEDVPESPLKVAKEDLKKSLKLGRKIGLPSKFSERTHHEWLKKAESAFTEKYEKSPKAGHENNGKDEWLLTGIEELKGKLHALAEQVPDVVRNKSNYVDRLLDENNEELVRYIGCLCLGSTKANWNDMLTDSKARKAIVVGVVARALKEHVFGDYLFGADNDFRKELEDLDRTFKQHEGFERAQERAKEVKNHRIDKDAFQDSTVLLCQQMIKLLAPLWDGANKMSELDMERLREIIKFAARLARMIRLAPDVVYYWPPTFKDEEFEPARMEAINLEYMIQTSPYDKVTNSHGERAVLREGKKSEESEAIVRIVAFPGIVAYRQYGGILADNEIHHESVLNRGYPEDVRERFGEPTTAKKGFRSRLISKSVVYLVWGKQRLLTKEAGTSAHLDAMRDGKMGKYTIDSQEVLELYALWQKENPAKAKASGRK
ncbi:hypothetical protein Slin15195_G028850 [Septoria linicola]|uniref:Uncharacterized protein n=1 Tax=Septoria linicola TaxID=215465 RepID=A0A9Q9AP81_9PEZI|nr:hypothetical protein Slin14017_G027880 [Septoria linicola]USW49566.1 hypothetical protein Slin15195_G028850 [Septoria linicola]